MPRFFNRVKPAGYAPRSVRAVAGQPSRVREPTLSEAHTNEPSTTRPGYCLTSQVSVAPMRPDQTIQPLGPRLRYFELPWE